MTLSFCPKMQVYAREGKSARFWKICASQVFTSRGFALFSANIWYRSVQTNTKRNAWEVVCGLEVTFFGFAPVCTFLRRFAPVLHIFCATFLSVWVLQKNVHPWRIAHISWQVATAQIKVGSGWQWAEEFFKCVVVSKSARFAKLCPGHIFTSRKGDLDDDLLI